SVASVRAFADMYPRQPGIRILHYSFDVTVGDASDEMSVKDTIDLQVLSAGVTGIDLDLCSLITQPQPEDRLNSCLLSAPRQRNRDASAAAAPPPSNVGRGMTVTGVTADGKALTF